MTKTAENIVTMTQNNTKFWTSPASETDTEIFTAVRNEGDRQQNQIELIASENIVSRAVLDIQGSVLTNKYAEGYPKKRYYQGCEFVDQTEQMAIDRVKKLYNCAYANVQPHSGANANQAVFLALLEPHDTFLGMSLDAGGHLTHGCPVNQSGKWFNAVTYGLTDEGLIDYDEAERLALEHKPKIIIAGASAYPRHIDWARFREIADKVDAYFMVDMAHYSGLIAAGEYPDPLPHAHVVTSTTHKTLRGPRGGIILSNDLELGKKLNSAVFPGLQGGPLEHVIAAKAVAFGEALRPEFKTYQQNVIANARTLGAVLKEGGLDLVSGGTDSHMLLVDLRPKGLTGKAADQALEHAGITCNKNTVPDDPKGPFVTSGIRLGTPAGTTRGFMTEEWTEIGNMILEVLNGLVEHGEEGNAKVEADVRARVKDLCARFPIYK
jgi:glycine hydroxymethyltransferase